MDLTGANFKGIKNSSNISFRNSILDNANFEGAEIHKSFFRYGFGKFIPKSVKGINLSNVDFNWQEIMFNDVDLTGANFKGIKNSMHLTFGFSILDNANFEGAEIHEGNFGNKPKSVKGINFSNVDFKEKFFSFSNLDFTGANFTGIKNARNLSLNNSIMDNVIAKNTDLPYARYKSNKNMILN